LQYVGVTAKNTGFSIEETGKMIGFLASNGLRMSKVGTGLRNVLMHLAESGEDVRDVLDRMNQEGLSVSDAFDIFGRRGANAALLLINQWGEVKDMMENDMPIAADRMLKAAQALDSKTGFAK